MAQVDPEQITAFRMARHGLGRRPRAVVPLAELVPLGLQDTAVGCAAQALAVRVPTPSATALGDAVAEGRLIPTWGPRRAATLVPLETEVLVSGALLDPRAGGDNGDGGDVHTRADLVRVLAPVALGRLRARGPLTKAEVGEAIADAVPADAMVRCERCGRTHPAEDLVKMLVWAGRIRLQPLPGATSRFAPSARWRPRRFRKVTNRDRGELVRQYLHRYAPSTPGDLAAWAGIEPRYASACWSLVERELAPVDGGGGTAWCLERDRDELAGPSPPPSARLVPAYDPLL